MSQQDSFTLASFALNSRDLTRTAITTVRIALGIGGVVALAVGLMMTFWPARTAVVLTWLLGVYWIVAALVYLAIAIFAKGMKLGSRILDVVLGVLMLIAAVIVLSNPSESAVVLGLFLGIYVGVLWVIEGVVTLAQSGDAPSRAWAIFFGALNIVAGIMLFFSPWWGIQVLFLLTGISLVALGIVQLIRAFRFGSGGVADVTVV